MDWRHRRLTWAAGAPQVVGNVIGNLRIERTARNANAWASSASPMSAIDAVDGSSTGT
jgi:hypothetical protein